MLTSYPATFHHVSAEAWQISIKLKGDLLKKVGRILPTPKSSLQVLIAGVSDHCDPNSILEGTVMNITPHDGDFGVEATLPFALQDDEAFDLEDGGQHGVHVLWHGEDQDNRRKIEAVRSACAHGERLVPAKGIEARGFFCLRSIIADPASVYLSCPLLDDWRRDHPTDDDIFDAGLNDRQRAFVHAAMSGVPAAVLMLEDFPGTGKSKTLGCLTTMLALMGYRVLLQSQSSKGVDALFESATRLMERFGPADFAEKGVRIRSEVLEQELVQHLQSGFDPVDDDFAATNYWMARCIERYMLRCPHDDTRHEYRSHLRARRENKRPTSHRPWKVVVTEMRDRVLAEASVVGTTAFVAMTLGDTDFRGDVAIFDECGQATDPDLMMGITKELTDLKLLVLGGDTAQVGPVVPSDTAKRNSLGNVLGVPALQRIKQAFPEYTRVEPNLNYRGHHSTLAMSSKISYQGQMKIGRDLSAFGDATSCSP
ncbi:hypothetical protein LTR53_011175 [Teratosphaeriaceae sp. CCFEE 6253]|nr:hypothetical protein LTR53_011175 [Teratosphaeriaceae sp. CCFEE 6253]